MSIGGLKEPRIETCGDCVAWERKRSELRETPPHAGFREFVSGLYDLQCSLTATAFTFKRFRFLLCTLLDDCLWLKWKRKFGCDS